MKGDFRNVYDDETRARAYAELKFPGTYYLAFRDLPAIFARHAPGRRAMDFGCGTGRSTRFLRDLGFSVVGVDISVPMLEQARERDPGGDYRQVAAGELGRLDAGPFDLILSAFTFDNVATLAEKEALLRARKGLLGAGGRIVNLVSSPEIYVHEWASFSTRDYPRNRAAKSGDRVQIVMLDVVDARPVEDVLCTNEDYLALYGQVGLAPLEVVRPLATGEEPVAWVSETVTAPWTIYILRSDA